MNRNLLRRTVILAAMPGLALVGLLLLLLLLGHSAVGATPAGEAEPLNVQVQTATFTVSGTVICESTGPISDVEVFVWDRDGGTGGFTGDLTDSSGNYSVTLSKGNYELSFHPPCGSACASRSFKGITGPPDRRLDVLLPPGHTVSGTVTDGTTPVGNVAIYAFNHDTTDGFGLLPTDQSGHYCIGLVSGTYDLGFTPPPCRGLGPRTVVVPITQDMSLDVILPPGFTVAGCVTDEWANPVPGVQIYANGPDIGGFGFAPTNQAGCYTGTLPLSGNPPTGIYDIQFIPPAGLGLGSVTVTDVTSTTAGCPNTALPITLPGGFTLSGRVTCREKGIKNTFVYAVPEGLHDPTNSLPGYGIFTVDDGSYELPLVPGTYTVTFTPPPAAGLSAHAFGTVELFTDTVLGVDFCVCSGVWITEIVDSAGDVGQFTSVALEPTYPYTPHISYHNVSSQSLKHAWLSKSTWLSETLDPHGGQKTTSIAVVPTFPHTPCVSYYDHRETWGVKFAYRDTTAWITEVIEGGHSQGVGGTSLAIEPTYPYTPHVSYHLPWNINDLKHAQHNATTWTSGTWVSETVDSDGSIGFDNSLALEPIYPYAPHISYYDYTNGDLKHAWLSGTTWLRQTVDREGDVGRWSTSLALDSSSNPRISYLDATNRDLKYAWLSGTIWLSETVDRAGDVGWFTSLELDHKGNPHISYYDRTHGDLRLARFNGRVWTIQKVDSRGDVGQHSSLVLNGAGCPHISYYDATNKDLKYAYIPPLADVTIDKSSEKTSKLKAVGQPTYTLVYTHSVTYTLVYTNNGPDEAINVVIADPLDPQLTDVSVQTWASYPGGAPSTLDRYTWTIPGVPVGGWGIITITARVRSPVPEAFTLTNQATITTTTHVGYLDPHLADNTSTVHITVGPLRLYLPLVLKHW